MPASVFGDISPSASPVQLQLWETQLANEVLARDAAILVEANRAAAAELANSNLVTAEAAARTAEIAAEASARAAEIAAEASARTADTNALIAADLLKVSKDSDTGAASIPAGTTAQRKGVPVVGDTRFNTTTGANETYDGAAWLPELTQTLGDARYAPLVAGHIIDFAGSTAPAGYLACPIAATNISRTTYAALFAAIGTTWGVGDGSTTFGMPWFADGDACLAGATPAVVKAGQMPAHTHTVPVAMTKLANAGVTTGGIGTSTSGSAGSGTRNFAAGNTVLKCVKY